MYVWSLGIYSNKDVTKELYYSLYSMQHRGQESCGLALLDDGEIKYKRYGISWRCF